MTVSEDQKPDANVTEARPPVSLLYETADQWIDVPAWAEFFRAVGRLCIETNDGSQRLVVGVAVPTRAFAAGFAALGAVEARLSCGVHKSATEHVNELFDLPKGETVTVNQVGKKYVATFERRDTVRGRDGIWVRYEKDGLNAFLPADEFDRVMIGRLGKDSLPKRLSPRGTTKHRWDARFVEAALSLPDATRFAREDDLAALIIGHLLTLSYDLEEAEFAVRAGQKTFEGHLEDLIRTKKFADDPKGEAFRTEVMSDRARDVDEEIAALNPPLAIFDGARAFEKHHRELLGSSWIVILEQSDRGTEGAAAILSESYVQRLSDIDPLQGIAVPPAIEIISFLLGCS